MGAITFATPTSSPEAQDATTTDTYPLQPLLQQRIQTYKDIPVRPALCFAVAREQPTDGSWNAFTPLCRRRSSTPIRSRPCPSSTAWTLQSRSWKRSSGPLRCVRFVQALASPCKLVLTHVPLPPLAPSPGRRTRAGRCPARKEVLRRRRDGLALHPALYRPQPAPDAHNPLPLVVLGLCASLASAGARPAHRPGSRCDRLPSAFACHPSRGEPCRGHLAGEPDRGSRGRHVCSRF